jgi:hypothetical protein
MITKEILKEKYPWVCYIPRDSVPKTQNARLKFSFTLQSMEFPNPSVYWAFVILEQNIVIGKSASVFRTPEDAIKFMVKKLVTGRWDFIKYQRGIEQCFILANKKTVGELDLDGVGRVISFGFNETQTDEKPTDNVIMYATEDDNGELMFIPHPQMSLFARIIRDAD